MEEEVITMILEQNNITGVIIVSLLDKEKETYYVPGTTTYAPYHYGRPYYGYYGSVYSNVYSPGYYQSTTSYFLECNAYRLSDARLAYSAQSKTVDPSSVNKFAYDFAKLIVNDLSKRGVLAGVE